jgi:hypothetical protein
MSPEAPECHVTHSRDSPQNNSQSSSDDLLTAATRTFTDIKRQVTSLVPLILIASAAHLLHFVIRIPSHGQQQAITLF